MKHLDLFSGIGGFAYAADQVWDNVEHIFCDNEPFAREVLNKHWPGSKIYDDIKAITDTESWWERGGKQERPAKQKETARGSNRVSLLTGGFPCQPFSAAGLRRGTADERHLWPEMLRVIRLSKPKWVIAENVGGLVTWDEGMVLEQICTDMEAEGYEVQPFIIPAVAVNAPHRRDRIWFVAKRTESNRETLQYAPEPRCKRQALGQKQTATDEQYSWQNDWLEVATELCSLDDGLPASVGDFTLTKAQHRNQQLKAYGNAIVPQVAIEIMKGIDL